MGDLEDYLGRLSPISDPVAQLPAEDQALIRRMVGELEDLETVGADSLAELIRGEPDFVPYLAAIVGLSQERLKGQLKANTGSASWITRSREEPETIIGMLDEHFDLVVRAEVAVGRTYTLGDILIARSARKAGAAAGITSGRELEDQVEAVIVDLGLSFSTRTQFEGMNGKVGPADFAIPEGGPGCQIAVGVKGFDSTGSKLTAAVDEVRHMVAIRKPQQYMLAVVDGTGWHARQGDLGRLIEMRQSDELNGLYTVNDLADLSADLKDAALRLGLIDL